MSPLLHPISACWPAAALPTFQHLCLSESRWFPSCCRPHQSLEAALEAAQGSVSTLQQEKNNALMNVKYFLALNQELEEVNGALGTFK